MKRVAVVTGANRGMGLATAKALAEKGYHVVLTARDAAKAAAAAADLAADGVEVEAATLDVSDDESVAAFFEGRDRIDVLVNNGGVFLDPHGATASDGSPDTLLRSFDINTVGVFRVTRYALPMMNKAGYGRIVTVSSGMGGVAEMDGGYPGYRLSKAAANALTRVFG